MSSRRFTRLTNGFSKKLDNHLAAVALYVAHYNLCRIHEALRTTPAKALGVCKRRAPNGRHFHAPNPNVYSAVPGDTMGSVLRRLAVVMSLPPPPTAGG